MKYMGVDHSSLDILMAEQFLDGADIVAVLEQVRGEGMPEGVRCDRLVNTSRLSEG